MKKHSRIWLALATGALCSVLLTACVSGNDGNENSRGQTEVGTDTVEAVGTVNPTETGASVTEDSETEAVTTAIPRYDYFAAQVAPNVTIDKSAYTNVTVTLPTTYLISEEDVMDYIDYLRFDYRTADNGTEKMTDQAMKLGDTAYIYYRGVIDGEEFEGGSNWDDEDPHELGLGSGAFIPGFEEGLVGIVPANTSREHPAAVQVTFPEDYSKTLAGKNATFYVYVEYAVQYTMSEYTREFVENTLDYQPQKDFYASDKALLNEFEVYVKEYLEEQNASTVDSAKSTALWDLLLAAATVENMPQDELNYYYDYYVSDIEHGYKSYTSYYGTEFTDKYPTVDLFAISYLGLEDDADWKETMRSHAEKAVKQDMIVHAIAEMEGMEEITDEEFDEEVQYWVEYYVYYGVTAEEVIENMGEDYLRQLAFTAKMNEFFDANVTIVYAD